MRLVEVEQATGAPSPTFAVWGHFHGGNLGDELVVDVLVEAIRARVPRARIVAVSMTTEDTERRHGISAFQITPAGRSRARSDVAPAAPPTDAPRAPSRGLVRRLLRRVPGAHGALRAALVARRILVEFPFALRSYRFLRGVDVLVVAGSGQLLDSWHGPWEHPLTTYRWSILARLARTPVVIPSIGAGPIDTRLGRRFLKRAVDACRFISVRDASSSRVLRGIGVRRELPICPDMAWAVRVPDDCETAEVRTFPRVGLNVMSHQDPRYIPGGSSERYDAYLAAMTTLVELLLDQHEVVLFSSQTRADPLTASDLLARLGERGLATHPNLTSRIEAIHSVDDLVDTVASCDYVVAARFHCALLPLAFGIPTIALAYHDKTRAVMSDVGQADRCVDIDGCTPEKLYESLEQLIDEDSPAARAALRSRARSLAAVVEGQFDLLFGPRTAVRAGETVRSGA